MSKWEYLQRKEYYVEAAVPIDIVERYNFLGKDGWELVSYSYVDDYHISLFKRPLRDTVFKTKNPKQYEEQAKKILNE